jgi:hypothetical protein
MIRNRFRSQKVSVRVATALAGLGVASCAPMYPSPQQVQSSNPSVTYTYHTDQDLLQVNQSAATFCTRYQSVPQATNFTTDQAGNKVVVFQCVPPAAAAAAPMQPNPNLTYSYQTDQQLLEASRNAQTYCASRGSQQVTSRIVTNPDGTRTVAFQCNPQ